MGLRVRGRDDSGQVIVIVLILALLLASLGPIIVSEVSGDGSLVESATQVRGALAAADAGIQWYESQLDNVPGYYQDPGSDPAISGWCSSSCGLPTSAPSESFHYTPDASGLLSDQGSSAGEVLLTVTGRAGVPGSYSYATLKASFRRSSILDNAYFSNYELLDPGVISAYANNHQSEYQVTLGSGQQVSEMTQTVTDSGVPNVSVWQALCQYYTYAPNTFVDSLGTVATGVKATPDYTSNYPYYGPYYGGQFSFTQNGTSITVSASACGGQFEFVSNDQFTGPVYTEDQLHVCGYPQFQGKPVSLTSGAASSTIYDYDVPGSVQVTASNSGTGKTYPASSYNSTNPQYAPGGVIEDSSCTGTPTYSYGGGGNPVINGKESMPSSNSSLQTAAASSGCVYTGPTMIELVTVNGATTMDVWSPLSTTSATSSTCSHGQSFSASNPFITGITMPNGGVIYVQSAATGSSGVSVPDCTNSYFGPGSTTSCTEGNAYVEGELAGQLTIGAANDIIITRDITYSCTSLAGPASLDNPASYCTSGSQPDLLGLDAGSDVIVSRPDTSSNPTTCAYDGTGSPGASQSAAKPSGVWPSCDISNPIIDAAVLATGGAFGIQSYSAGSPNGTVNFNGADVSNYRGPFGTFTTSGNGTVSIVSGYFKNFAFDSRLQYLTPPDMVALSGSGWQEVDATFCGNEDTESVPIPRCPVLP